MEQEIIERLKRIERYSVLSAKDMLTLADVTALYGISKNYLYRLTCTGKIPHYKPIGKMIFFSKKEVEDWLRRNPSEDDPKKTDFTNNNIK